MTVQKLPRLLIDVKEGKAPEADIETNFGITPEELFEVVAENCRNRNDICDFFTGCKKEEDSFTGNQGLEVIQPLGKHGKP